jgi:hypothetical protein
MRCMMFFPIESSVSGMFPFLVHTEYGLIYSAIRTQHESTVSELYRLLSRKRNHGSAFPSIDLEDVEREPSFEEFEEWKRQLELGVGYATI